MLEELPVIFDPIETMGLLPTCRNAFCFGLLWFLRRKGILALNALIVIQ